MIYLYHDTEINRKDIQFGIDRNFIWKCKQEWFQNPLVPQIVRMLDKTEYLGGMWFNSPILDMISPQYLSGAVKCLIMAMAEPDLLYPLSYFGDNCGDIIDLVVSKYDLKFAWKEYLPKMNHTTLIYVNATGETIHGDEIFTRPLWPKCGFYPETRMCDPIEVFDTNEEKTESVDFDSIFTEEEWEELFNE